MIDQPAKPRTLPNAPTLTVRFFLRHGAMVEWPVPPQPAGAPFAMQGLALRIRADGFFCADDLYIPGDEIACIGLSGSTARVQAPGTGTRQ